MKKVLNLRKLCVRMCVCVCVCVSYTDQGSRAGSHTDPSKPRVCAIPGQEGANCCVHFQTGRARVCSAVRHHTSQSHTRILTSVTRSRGGADGRDGALCQDFTVYYAYGTSGVYTCMTSFFSRTRQVLGTPVTIVQSC